MPNTTEGIITAQSEPSKYDPNILPKFVTTAPIAINQEAIKDCINQLRDLCFNLNRHAGWWTDLNTNERIQRNVGELLMLMVSELAEAMEGHRKNLMDDKLPHRSMLVTELADCVIRIMDFAGAYSLDLGGALAEKLVYNQTREDHKIENRVKPDGKKY